MLYLLRETGRGRARAIWYVPLLFAAWVNLHGGWIVGLAVLGVWMLGDAWQNRSVRWTLLLAAVGALALLATLFNPYGAGLEPVQHDPPSPDMRGDWGHVGPMEFGVGVTNLDGALEQLAADGIETHSGPQTIEVDGGTWRYAYVVDPDGLYVYLTEGRY